jgi:hypothetical protein
VDTLGEDGSVLVLQKVLEIWSLEMILTSG